MAKSIKEYINQDTIEIPSIMVAATTAGYMVCGAPCAGAGAALSAIDLGLKYSGYTDSYHLTSATLGAVIGHKLIKPFVSNYNNMYSEASGTGGDEPEGSVATIAPSMLLKMIPVSTAALGTIIGKAYNELEQLIANYYEATEKPSPIKSVKQAATPAPKLSATPKTEKVYIEKIVEKPVEKTVYVDKTVEVEKPVYVDRVVESPCELVQEAYQPDGLDLF